MQDVRIDDSALARRLRLVREELYGDGGVPRLAEALGVPTKTWEHYEAAVKMPAGILLAFLAVTGAQPRWLLTGKGSRYDREDSVVLQTPTFRSTKPTYTTDLT